MKKIILLGVLAVFALNSAIWLSSCNNPNIATMESQQETMTATAAAATATAAAQLTASFTPHLTPTAVVTVVAHYTSNSPSSLAIDTSNNVYVAVSGGSIFEILSSGVTTVAASNGGAFANPANSLAYDGTYFYETTSNYVIQCNVNGSAVTLTTTGTAYGTAVNNASPATVFVSEGISPGTLQDTAISGWPNSTVTNLASGSSYNPFALSVDSNNNVYYWLNNHTIGKCTSAGVTSVLAGTGNSGYVDGTASSAKMGSVNGTAVDSSGNVYFVDTSNLAIREITGGNVITLVGPSGVSGVTPLFVQTLVNPEGVAVDSNGNVYFSDQTGGSSGYVYKFTI